MTTVQITKRPNSNYTETEIKEGLTVMALCSGNKRRAAREMEARGKSISPETLRYWKERHPVEYERIVQDELPKVYAEVAERCEDLALAQAEAEDQLLTRLVTDMADMDARDVSTALRNVGVAKSLNIDKASVIRGRPTEITEHRTLVDVARSLKQYAGMIKVNGDVVDGQARELTSGIDDADADTADAADAAG